MTEAEVLAWLATNDRLAAEHPEWTAFQELARRARALYVASRRQWRDQSPQLDVAAVERDYDLSPATLAIRAQR